MITGVEKQARPHGELIRELLDSRIPKSDAVTTTSTTRNQQPRRTKHDPHTRR